MPLLRRRLIGDHTVVTKGERKNLSAIGGNIMYPPCSEVYNSSLVTISYSGIVKTNYSFIQIYRNFNTKNIIQSTTVNSNTFMGSIFDCGDYCVIPAKTGFYYWNGGQSGISFKQLPTDIDGLLKFFIYSNSKWHCICPTNSLTTKHYVANSLLSTGTEDVGISGFPSYNSDMFSSNTVNYGVVSSVRRNNILKCGNYFYAYSNGFDYRRNNLSIYHAPLNDITNGSQKNYDMPSIHITGATNDGVACVDRLINSNNNLYALCRHLSQEFGTLSSTARIYKLRQGDTGLETPQIVKEFSIDLSPNASAGGNTSMVVDNGKSICGMFGEDRNGYSYCWDYINEEEILNKNILTIDNSHLFYSGLVACDKDNYNKGLAFTVCPGVAYDSSVSYSIYQLV